MLNHILIKSRIKLKYLQNQSLYAILSNTEIPAQIPPSSAEVFLVLTIQLPVFYSIILSLLLKTYPKIPTSL